MIRVNKNLAIFLGLILLFGLSSFTLLQKFLPFVSHTVYYCQSFINSLSMPIPYYFGVIPLLLFFIFMFVAVAKLFITYAKVQLSRKSLMRNRRSNMGFSILLEKLQLTDKTYLIKSQRQFAFCLGIRHPKIYISTSLISILTPQEIEAVLRHERYHLSNRDSLTMLVASVGESLLPFFPLLSDLLRNFRIEREIKADAEAINAIGDEKPLISVLKKLLATPSVATVTASAIADRDTLEPRIHALVKKDFRFKKFRVKHVLISLCSFFIMGVITLVPVQAVEVNHMGEDVTMICPHGSLCMNECKQEYSTKKVNHSEELLYSSMK